jgi:rubrerythrin
MSGRVRTLLALALAGLVPSVGHPSFAGYVDTISVMQAALQEEKLAQARYDAYAEKALEEKYPQIAYLSHSLAESERIHVRNIAKVLEELGQSADVSVPSVVPADTRTNLKTASTMELEDINSRFPEYIGKVEPEGFTAAITALSQAWEAEKRHGAQLSLLQAASGVLFGVLAKAIEERVVDYYLCGNCGTIVAKPPQDRCPVCSGPASGYRRIDPVW